MEELIGSHSSRARVAGRHRSPEHQQALRLDTTKSQLLMTLSVTVLCAQRAGKLLGRKEGKVADTSRKVDAVCVTCSCATTKIVSERAYP